jgi:enterochelin esterase-like enzyme
VSLIGKPFLVLITVLALAVLCLVVWVIPRTSGPGVTRVLGRIGLLFGCQICCVLALLTALNFYFDFYGSWGDLLGYSTTPGHGAITGRPEGRPMPPTGPRRVQAAGTLETVKDGFIRSNQLKPALGRLESVIIRGQVSGITTAAYIYLPPQYFEPRYARQRFPVAIAFTGYPGDAHNLITRLKLPQMVGREIQAGQIQPMMLVMMRPTVVAPRDTECTDIPGGPQTETLFSQDIPSAMKAAYRASVEPSGWSLMGDSTGGYCAVKLAMRHSDRFGAAIALAGYYHALSDITTGSLYGGSRAYRNENDLFWRMRHLPIPPVNVLLTTSRKGERDFKDTERFISLARLPMRIASVILPTGGHHFDVWDRELPPALAWLSAHTAAGPNV